MERESLVSILIMLLGGTVLQPFALWPSRGAREGTPAEIERRTWIALWIPVVPMLLVAAGLIGWALREPDPVRDPLDPFVLLAVSAPFGLIFLRAAARAVWALASRPVDCGVSTIGLIQPQVVFSPFLARQLEEGVIRAALGHERSHALHRDPLRIWVAQLITDLQWPWPWAMRRLEAWLDALELARDDEARASGADGADLAAALLASVRYMRKPQPQESLRFRGTQLAHARLTGESRALRNRVSRLLAPLSEVSGAASQRSGVPGRAGYLLIALLATAMVLGAAFGERIMHPLLAMTI